MYSDRKIWVNGEMVPWERAQVHLMNHSMGRGSAIFEVLCVHPAGESGVVFRLKRHVARFFNSARLLHMRLDCTPEDVMGAICTTVRANAVSNGIIKLMGYYGDVAISIQPPDSPLDVAVCVVDLIEDLGGVPYPIEEGATLGISTWRKLDPRTVPIGAKAAANYLNGLMANADVGARGYQEALLLDIHGRVAEGPTDSVFVALGGVLHTPPLDGILDSITRDTLIKLAAYLDIPVQVGPIERERLFEAEEIILSSTVAKVLPVRRFEDRPLEVPGPLTRRLKRAVQELLTGELPEFAHWLSPVG
ncbi:MAG: aminotransferase class IV [Desulfosarcinaceae bacterium]|nr:aminotransferase class IV [Desulfosarcinaceae bacterium]